MAAWRADGDQATLDRLMPLVYEELRRMASRRLRSERPDHTLQPTALVHEAYARMVDGDVDFVDRAHFLAVAATAMRRVLVDHARRRGRLKRGGGAAAVTLSDDLAADSVRPDDIIALDEAIASLAARDERKARVVELHFFGGLTYPEIGTTIGISEATVDRDLRMAKAWLARALADD